MGLRDGRGGGMMGGAMMDGADMVGAVEEMEVSPGSSGL